jgi:hypothetical protein
LLRQHLLVHLNAAQLTHVVFGQCSMPTELLPTTLFANHQCAVGENGPDNVLSHKLHQTQSHMTQLVEVVIGEPMTK